MKDPRRQLVGAEAIAAAIERGEPVRLLLARDPSPPAPPLADGSEALVASCESIGIPVRRCSEREMKRMSSVPGAEVLALAGADPHASLEDLLASDGSVWLLAGVGYPGNAGFAIRTAEVSGAEGIVIDGPLGHSGRRQALRTAMRADRFFPVCWAEADAVVRQARAHGRRIVGIEDCGGGPPWRADLTGTTLFVIGGEAGGIPATVLASCDETVRIPMRGFIPSYNLQAAMAMVAGERLRQIENAAR